MLRDWSRSRKIANSGGALMFKLAVVKPSLTQGIFHRVSFGSHST